MSTTVKKDFEWVKKCIESCIHIQQLQTSRRLIEAYRNKWESQTSNPRFVAEMIEDVVTNVCILERTLIKKQNELLK